jgi:hypothetical protein
MKGYRIIVVTACAIVAVAAAITAIVIFRNEIAEFISELTGKIEGKIAKRKGDYDDFDDV